MADRKKRKGSFKLSEVFPPSAQSAKIREYEAGETIIAQGDKCSDIHYVEAGLIKLHVVSERGRSAVLGIVGAGEFFGESCMSGNLNHLTSAVALVPTTVAAIKQKTDGAADRGRGCGIGDVHPSSAGANKNGSSRI